MSAHGAANNNISVTHDDTANASAQQHPAAPPPEKQDFVVKDAQGNRVNAPTQSGAGAFYPVAGAHTSQKPVSSLPNHLGRTRKVTDEW